MYKILSVPIYSGNILQLVADIVNNCIVDNNFHNKIITATSAHGVVSAQYDNEILTRLCATYLNIPDGVPLVWVGWLKGHKDAKRCFGPDFFRETIIDTKDNEINHFFCGGKEGVAEKLRYNCQVNFGNNHIVGTYTPPFREMMENEIIDLAEKINSLNTNIVWIGLSTPKQEKFANQLSKYTNVNFICTIGAAFDYHTQTLKRAPIWMQKSGLEWFFRLMLEPKRLWKRYFQIVPLFIFYNLKEVLTGNFFNKN